MDQTTADRMHAAREAGLAADAAIAAARAPVAEPMTKEERAEFLSHSKELLPGLPFAEMTRPMSGDLGNSGNAHRTLSTDPLPGIDPGSVLGAITSPFGSPRGSFEAVKPTDHIRIGNTTTTLAVALKMGVIQFNSRTGEYTAPAPPSPEALAQATAAQAEADSANAPIDPLSPEVRQVISNIDELTGGRSQAVVASAISRGIDGDMAAAASAFTEATGQKPGEETENVALLVQNAMASTAAILTSRYGVDGVKTLEHISQTFGKAERARLAVNLYAGDKGTFEFCASVGRKLARHAASGK